LGVRNPAAAELLCLCAYIHPEEILEELLTTSASDLGSVLGLVAANPIELNMVMAVHEFSLLRRDPAMQTLEMHRLVQVVVRAGMDDATQRQWAERVVRSLDTPSGILLRLTCPVRGGRTSLPPELGDLEEDAGKRVSTCATQSLR